MTPQLYIMDDDLDDAERTVLAALQSLPEDCIVYAQPNLVFRSRVRHPDFVIVSPKWNVLVVEVKDWIAVEECDATGAKVKQRSGEVRRRGSPVEQARKAAEVLSCALEKDPNLVDYAGRRQYYYNVGGALPHLTSSTISWLERIWGEGYLLGRGDLRQDVLPERIERLIKQCDLLDERQVRAICAAIDRTNEACDHSSGEFKGVYDREQESIAKEPVRSSTPAQQQEVHATQPSLDRDLVPSGAARRKHLRTEMSEEAESVALAPHVRLVRGYAGTGKTDVLILRAHYLHRIHPDLSILVTTFNDPLYRERLKPELEELAPQVDVIKFDTLCSGVYRRKHGLWRKPQDTGGMVATMVEDHPTVQEYGQTFITNEIIWMKETGRTERSTYVNKVREGRGAVSGLTLQRGDKEGVFDVFEAYQKRLAELPAYDWVDLHDKALRYLQEGIAPERRYDAILVDEAQHFAPTWMRIVKEFLRPGGHLFLCDDPSQSVYRYYSWRQKGIEVRGRTRWLRVPYRNTRQVFEAAYALIRENELAQTLLTEEEGHAGPDFDNRSLRDGPRPEVHSFSDWGSEQAFLVTRIKALIETQGVLPREIGVLHEESYVRNRYRTILPHGVRLHKMHRQTGLEYKAVFIPKAQDLFERSPGVGWKEYMARQQLKAYMAMTRSRKWLYVLYQGGWPKIFEPVRPHVDFIEH